MQHSAKMFSPSNIIFLFSFCLLPLSVYLISDEEFESFKIEMNHLRSRQDDLESRVDMLEELAKIGTLRSCAEYAQYVLKTSGLYMIDPDGPLLGQPPFQVFCDFKSGMSVNLKSYVKPYSKSRFPYTQSQSHKTKKFQSGLGLT